MIKLLDCTLRDGGYVNNWEFGKDNIAKIISELTHSGINFVECGFLKDINYNNNFSLFSNILQLKEFLISSKTKYTLMINYGEYSLDKIPNSDDKSIMIRLSFKKKHLNEALIYADSLIHKGYDIFINPMNTDLYSTDELLYLIQKINKINPYAVTIVDTIGCMCEKDAVNIFKLIKNELNENIKICFHSHNNLQLSFSNALSLINLSDKRDLIIDSTLFAMGRGAGNIKTEKIIKYLNDNCNTKFDYIPVLKLIDEVIYPIFKKSPWGASTPYYLAAIHHCHPNYAKFILDKEIHNVDIIIKIFSSIPKEYKYEFNLDIIQKLYSEFKVC